MKRDISLVVGNQGCGKSVWTKAKTAASKRLFCSDPLASYPDVDFLWEIERLEEILRHEIREFRVGTFDRDELQMIGDAAYSVGDCDFVIEETALMFDRGAKLEPWANRLVFMGRHPRVNLFLVAQRATKIPLDIRSQATRIITFRQTEPDDVDAICERIGGDFYDEIRTLPDLHCLDWDGGAVHKYAVCP